MNKTVSITTDSSGTFVFSPATITITVGSTVTWNNLSQAAHTVTSDNGIFNSGTIPSGGSYSFKFTKAGTYTYHCSFHPYMVATIVVQ